MDVTLWIAAALLATVALLGGISKTFVPLPKLAAAPGGEWTGHAGAGLVRTLGILELLAAVGLVLPAVLGIAPVMVAVTAICWILLMLGAIVTHLRYGDPRFIVLNLVYLGLAAYVAWGRLGPQPFPS
ncbi:DoxX family protein [Pseudonocardia humida]|uniref:DoxX family protein n=1 Tax=Pseudonocardia humida TaxID=2800819 RepID=A0ABT1A339_9PSEU|nr:DoxX family protein [Pseudonocardia humida]MCO1657412.1 DoxX family protein [Pseudonocardia humida]